jgi:hypothetical protein
VPAVLDQITYRATINAGCSEYVCDANKPARSQGSLKAASIPSQWKRQNRECVIDFKSQAKVKIELVLEMKLCGVQLYVVVPVLLIDPDTSQPCARSSILS